MKIHKGFPYREKKKKRTREVEDLRPHLFVEIPYRGTVRRSQIEKEIDSKSTERNFCVPNLQYIEDHGREEWDKNDAHTLIDLYAMVAWNKSKGFHAKMSRLVTHFQSLWRRQKGKCAVTDLPLIGGPGLGCYGIGIDVLRRKQGPSKGNIRLVSFPIAIARTFSMRRSQELEMPKKGYYKNQPIAHIIAHNMFWKLKKEQPFKNLPVQISFPEQGKRSYGRPPYLVVFSWDLPKTNHALDQNRYHSESEFCKVAIDGEVIKIDGLMAEFAHAHEYKTIKLSLGDPTIDVFQIIIEEAKKNFSVGLARSLMLRNHISDDNYVTNKIRRIVEKYSGQSCR